MKERWSEVERKGKCKKGPRLRFPSSGPNANATEWGRPLIWNHCCLLPGRLCLRKWGGMFFLIGVINRGLGMGLKLGLSKVQIGKRNKIWLNVLAISGFTFITDISKNSKWFEFIFSGCLCYLMYLN